MNTSEALTRRKQLLGKMCQHLHHGGMGDDEAAELIGVTAEVFRARLAEAERERPKLCAQLCTTAPRCPYCDSVSELHAKMGVRDE